MVVGATCLNPSVMASETLQEPRVQIAIEEMVKHNQLTPAVGTMLKEHTFNSAMKVLSRRN